MISTQIILVFILTLALTSQLQVNRRMKKSIINQQKGKNQNKLISIPNGHKKNRFKLKSKKTERFTMYKIDDKQVKEILDKATEDIKQEDSQEMIVHEDLIENGDIYNQIKKMFESCNELKAITMQKIEEDGAQKEEEEDKKEEAKKVEITFDDFIKKQTSDQGEITTLTAFKQSWVDKNAGKTMKGFQAISKGLKYINHYKTQLTQMIKSPAFAKTLTLLGHVGLGLSLGIKLVQLSVFIKKKVIHGSSNLYKNSDFGKTMRALDEIKESLSNLNSKIDILFEEQSKQAELQTAKQTIYQSVEIVQYAQFQFESMMQKCSPKVKEELKVKAITQEKNEEEKEELKYDENDFNIECDFYQRKFMSNLNSLNFDFHYKLLLKTYAGEISFLGVDYFESIVKAFNNDSKKIREHYDLFLEMMKGSTLFYTIFNQLNAKYHYEKQEYQDSIKRALSQYKSSNELIVQNINIISRVTNCDNCMKLDFQNRLWIAIGEKKYCIRTQNKEACDYLIDAYANSEEEQKKMNELLSKQKESQYNFNQDFKTNFVNFIAQYEGNVKFQQITSFAANSHEDIQKQISSIYYTYTQDQKQIKSDQIYYFISKVINEETIDKNDGQSIYIFRTQKEKIKAKAQAIMIYKDENDVEYRKEILKKFFNDHIAFLKKKLDSIFSFKHQGENCFSIYQKNYQKVLDLQTQFVFDCYDNFHDKENTIKKILSVEFFKDRIILNDKYLNDKQYTVIFDAKYNSMYLQIQTREQARINIYVALKK